MVYERGALWVVLSLRGHLGVNQAVSAALLQIEKIIRFVARVVTRVCYISKRKEFICVYLCVGRPERTGVKMVAAKKTVSLRAAAATAWRVVSRGSNTRRPRALFTAFKYTLALLYHLWGCMRHVNTFVLQ